MKDKQIFRQAQVWSMRAPFWDDCLDDPHHYVNFQNGYQRFLFFLKSKVKNLKINTSLELGCGTAEVSLYLRDFVKQIYLLDISYTMLEIAQVKLPDAIILLESVDCLSLPSGSVDLAVSRGVLLSHLPRSSIANFFDHIANVLRPGGCLLFDFLVDLNCGFFKNTFKKNVFTPFLIEFELKKRGFVEIEFDGTQTDRVFRVWAKKPMV